MLTLHNASAILAAASSLDSIAAVLRAIGFTESFAELDNETRSELGLSAEISRASVARGPGSLRGLAVQSTAANDFRELLGATAISLSKRSQHLLWIVVAGSEATREAAILCWIPTSSRIRTVALVYRLDDVVESDAETLCALAAATSDSDLLTHARWCDVLGREYITRRFFRTLQVSVDTLGASLTGSVGPADRRELSIICISRLLFLSFLESKGWLNDDFGFLSNGYLNCLEGGGQYQKRVLEPLFFGTLNTRASARSPRARAFGRIPFLNGGLFTRSHLEKRTRPSVFSDEALGNAFSTLFTRYRFTARESSTAWSEASVDPEMLGKAFEALMAAQDRKTSGAFYTPQSLVSSVSEAALANILGSKPEIHALSSVRVLDPACGSGAFVVYLLERLAALRAESGDVGSTSQIRRRVLTTSIFGVDSNPMAVWLCELRLWLSITIDSAERDPMKVTPLPNLDRNIRVGDSLLGGDFGIGAELSAGRRLTALRSRYVRATGSRKQSLARSLDRHERSTALETLRLERRRLDSQRRDLLLAARSPDLFGMRKKASREIYDQLAAFRLKRREIRKSETVLREGGALPFSYAAHFSDVARRGGFDVVVGNPPWVRIHNIPATLRERLRREFGVYRGAAWQSGAEHSGAGRGFAAQVDLSSLFVERSVALLGPRGVLSLLLPSKLWRSLAGGGVRRLVLGKTDLVAIEDYSNSEQLFDAAVYPSLLVCRAKTPTRANGARSPETFRGVVANGRTTHSWTAAIASLPFDDTPGSPWLLVPPAVRRAFDRLREAGIPLADSVFGRPLLGVKTGFNKAFVVRVKRLQDETAIVSNGERTAGIERRMIRPLVRGETIAAWSAKGSSEYLISPFGDDLRRSALPPLARAWLHQYEDFLCARTDLHSRDPWWSVFRTESADTAFARVVWSDFGIRPRAIVIAPGDRTVALNSCYVARCASHTDACALAVLLNSPLVAAWLGLIAEPARGGYRRFLGWTMSLLPIPRNWALVRNQLAAIYPTDPVDAPTPAELLEASLHAFGICADDVDPLLSWTRPSD